MSDDSGRVEESARVERVEEAAEDFEGHKLESKIEPKVEPDFEGHRFETKVEPKVEPKIEP